MIKKYSFGTDLMAKSPIALATFLTTMVLLGATVVHAANEPTPAPGTASIRGDIVEGFLGTTNRSRIVSVDGNLVTGAIMPCQPVPLTPGLHSLVVAYEQTNLPVLIDAKPDNAYAVKWTGDDPRMVYVENTATQEIFNNISTDADKLIAPYSEPMSEIASSATISPVQNMEDGLLGDFPIGLFYVSGVDGHFVEGYKPFSADREKVMVPRRLTPGPHALMISFSYGFSNPVGGGSGLIWLDTPIVFTAEPAKHYLLKYTKFQSAGGPYSYAYRFWIEEEGTGTMAYPEKLYSMNLSLGARYHLAGVPIEEATSFPASHGQRQKKASTPKPWCQHE
tara:strand:- start:6835 stop:7842 length:1008 start_codon:yes stop_codon:yes gene_type:complete